ncbi:3D-(3,5/4)-trihydroxycyclohexane-1,2-dione acylhydrolase (decyclizing) [Luteibacter sp. UNC138MFCol5.1]|uniref:3D-(3,5/4)-trihydroxycyclohexane-1,2-dione acylhydrolase (decyclizing) n=1 Tax=Luteibacter sp. UNC138MFCol5.1 TaxID=1502774 RepID=UPI0008C4544F|nr:3D-(3,5/4)-trihydroxycyclohexane-1,2-dione acylhydrolase (decyclizing) [Luteibacter sp. UNC138MFCol5.1]SEP07271.1 3D-(3,5/4)-trihydroxycyclohexane-1,2-dione acylhydrolase (decyclizing) [Luteibacter sp. UNC138MFCol5.1]
MSETIRLTCAQALVRYLAALRGRDADQEEATPLFGGVFAIFGHGNVAGLGEALHGIRDELPTYRAHNEQAMAHAAIAYAKTNMRRRMMAVTTSIGPGATNLVTAAALAHVNRLPVLLLPGDIFVSRAPDPVLQQLEDFSDGTVSVNDCFRPVSRYFDRIVRPEQLLTALPRAIRTLTDPALCGPVTLALPQDVQAEAYDFPVSFFEPREIVFRAPQPTDDELMAALDAIEASERPVIVAGGGALYAKATPELMAFAEKHGVPVCETQAGKGALPWNHPLHLGPAGVSGSTAANALLPEADLVIAVGTRLQDFTTGSNALFRHVPILSINVNAFDTLKGEGIECVGDAAQVLDDLSFSLEDWAAPEAWTTRARQAASEWVDIVSRITGQRDAPPGRLPYDGEVIGAVQRSSPRSAMSDIVVCAAGTLPAELEKLWRTETPGGYHMEYGYSCMGYEIAGGLGVKMAAPDREVIVMVGDGSYLMMNSEIATSVMLDAKLIIVLLDNRGYGCINRLQQATGGAPFNNMFDDCVQGRHGAPMIDFAAHARSLGAIAEHVADIAGLEHALERARAADRTYLISIDTDHTRTTAEGGVWWDVAVPEVSTRQGVRDARTDYETALAGRKARITPA